MNQGWVKLYRSGLDNDRPNVDECITHALSFIAERREFMGVGRENRGFVFRRQGSNCL